MPSPDDRTMMPDTADLDMTSPSVEPGSDFRGGHIPATIGRYRVLRVLGEGGMGVVYEAEQDQPRRLVALKVIKAAWASPELLRRFEQESQALGRLHHPGIAQIFEAGSAETGFGVQPFFAMELIYGRPLVAYANERRLSTRQRLELMIQVCDAVQHAHLRGIIHRDLKPGNILVDESGQPKILDFGLARATDSDAQTTRQTDMGQLLGTLAYMSPEQVLADPLALDTRSDVYALGVILYELLAGKLPYLLPKLLHEAVQTIRETDPAKLSTIDRTYRGDIETIVNKALEKDKNRRYASAADLAAELRRYLGDEPIVAHRASASYQLAKFTRRHKALVAGVAAVFVVLIAGTVVSTWQAVRARRAQKEAERQSDIARAVNNFLQEDLLAQASAYHQAKPDPDLRVRTALDRAAQNIAGKFKDQPEVEAAIRETIGTTYKDLGLYPEARTQLENSLGLSRKALGSEDARTLKVMADLGSLDEYQSKYPEAEALLTKTIDEERRILGAENPETLHAIRVLGGVYEREGKLVQAEKLDEELIATERRVSGPESPETLAAMNNLSLVYGDQGKYAQVVALRAQILDIYRRIKGPDHPDTANAMNNLANAYNADGKPVLAEATLKEAVQIDERVLGPEHPETLLAMSNFASAHIFEGKYAEAEALLEKVVALRRRILGPDHRSTLYSMQMLADAYTFDSQYSRAEALEKQVLEARRRTLGTEHLDTLYSLTALGDIYANEDRFGEAERVHSEALEIQRRVLGPEHPQTLGTKLLVGLDLANQGKHSQAEALDRQVFETRKRLLGPDNLDTIYAMEVVTQLDLDEGKYKESEAQYSQILEVQRRVIGAEAAATLFTLRELGEAYSVDGKFAAAERALSQAVASQQRILGRRNATTLLSEAYLIEDLQREDKYSQAEDLLKDAVASAESSEDSDVLAELSRASARAVDGHFRHAEQALKFARLAAKKAPGVPTIQNTLGLAQVRSGQWDEAVATLKKCIAMRNEPRPEDFIILALAYEGRGDKVNAKLNLQRGVETAKKRAGVDIDTILFAAEAASALGDPAPLPIPNAN